MNICYFIEIDTDFAHCFLITFYVLDSEGFEIVVDKKNGLTMPLNESETTLTKGGL